MSEIQTSNGLFKTVCCSYPRSGQALIRAVLLDYFGDRLKYCEWYRHPELRPNVCEETNFVKTHDRELNWHIREDWKYLVLIRNPVASVSSWKTMDHEKDNFNVGWKLDFWSKWFTRWVVNPVPNRLIVSYESLIDRPVPVFRCILNLLECVPIDEDRLRGSISKHDIRPRRNHAQEWLGYL